MVHIIPHINTLILDVGSKYTKVGYAGDFHPSIMEETAAEPSPERALKAMKKYVEELGIDSLVVVEDAALDMESRSRIVKECFTRKICSSIIFLKSPVCDAFGHGKTTCVVLSCSAGSMTASTIINGQIAEMHRVPVGSMVLEEYVAQKAKEMRDQCTADLLPPDSPSLPMLVLESAEIVDLLTERFGIDVFQPVRDGCHNLVEKIAEMRARHGINRKSMSSGCIVLSGGMFRYKPFLGLVRSCLVSRLSEDLSDLVLRERELDCTFAGASVFGMNDQTKMLYITLHDFQNIGMNAVRMKSLDRSE